MENEQIVGEQPEQIQPSQEEDLSRSSGEGEQKVEAEKVEAEKGVNLGKFKNVEELVKAYNNLQAEFTKKSQKLAEVLKDKVEEPAANMESGLQSFLSKNQEAAFYADELKTRVSQSDSFDEKAFETAWAGILYEKLSCPGKTKEPIIQKIIKDDEIQDLVVKNYVKQLQEQKTPIIMSSDVGERVTKTVTQKPDSFEDAKKVVLDLLS